MSSAETTVLVEPTVSLKDVRTFRERAIANGFDLIRVHTHSKSPLARAWRRGENIDALLDVRPEALNTGLLLAGLRCVDVDVDLPDLVAKILDQVRVHLPAGALTRSRANSPRVAILFRAADGQPPKRSINGAKGKIEVLGSGQQLVAHGLHTTGVPYSWSDGCGPDTVKLGDLPAVSEQQIDAFLSACAPLLGAVVARPEGPRSLGREFTDPSSLLPVAKIFSNRPLSDDLSAGIEVPHWFADLCGEDKKTLVRACLQRLDNRTTDPRHTWLRVLFAVGHAEQLGCNDARGLALEWSRQGASWISEADFEVAWSSYKPKSSGVTVGTLLAMARDAGLDLSSWRDLALGRCRVAGGQAAALVSASSARPHSSRARNVAALPSIPPKRQWLHGVDLVRGAVSLLVAPGGRGKSSWLVTLSLACASGRPLLGAHVFGGPLRVLLISAEDPEAEVALRLRATMHHHGVTDADVPGLNIIGADRWGQSLLCPGTSGPTLNMLGWDALTTELDGLEPDVLILDPLMSVMGGVSQNDNAAAALFMGQLVSVAAKRRIAVMVAHHASKGRDPISAESAMGAASFVNLSRIALGIEPLAEKDAGSVGLPPWEARQVFRVVGTKQNLSPPSENDRWFRLISVEMGNAEPPIYPNGDKMGVVEVFQPGASGAMFPPGMVRDALIAIDDATIPLSPAKNATDRRAVPVIEQAIAPHRGGHSSETEAKAILDHLIRSVLVRVDKVDVPRPGKGSDKRNGLVLTPAGKHVAKHQPPQSPQSPQPPATSIRDDAGGALLGPRIAQGGVGEMRGAALAGQELSASSVVPRSLTAQCGESAPATHAPEAAPVNQTRAAHPAPEPVRGSERDSTGRNRPLREDEAPEAAADSTAPEARANPTAAAPSGVASELAAGLSARASKTSAAPFPAPDFADLEIPDFLDRRKNR